MNIRLVGSDFHKLFKGEETMDIERVCSLACYALGLVFFVIALFGSWPHFFTMSICFASGLLIADEESSRTP